MRWEQSKEDNTVVSTKQRNERSELHEITRDETCVWSCIGDGSRWKFVRCARRDFRTSWSRWLQWLCRWWFYIRFVLIIVHVKEQFEHTIVNINRFELWSCIWFCFVLKLLHKVSTKVYVYTCVFIPLFVIFSVYNTWNMQ